MSGNLFEHLPLFAGLTPVQQDQLRPLFAACDGQAGTLLFRQGDPAAYLYVVVDGEVHVRYKPEDGAEMTVARVRSGGVVGWSAALRSPSYSASALCVAESQLIRARGDDLRELCERYSDTGSIILDRLAALIAERLRNTHGPVLMLLEQGLRTEVGHSHP